MMFDKWFKDKFEITIMKMLDRIGGSLTDNEKLKITKYTTNFYMFVVNIGFAMFMIYFFNTIVYNRIGFEKTIIIIISIIMLLMKSQKN